MFRKTLHLTVIPTFLAAISLASGATLPRGMGIGTPESMATAEQTRADLYFLQLGLEDTAIDLKTKEKLTKLLTDSESEAKDIVKSKATAKDNKFDQQAVALRDKLDKDIARIVNDKQISEWSDHVKIDFFQELIPNGREVYPLSVKDGGPGLDLNDKQMAQLLAEEDKKAAAMQDLVSATPETMEEKREKAINVTFKARQKLREVLTAEQKKKYDDWMLEQINKPQQANIPATKP
jgi:hypothetical protein